MFLTALLGWIPVLGPIVQSVLSIFEKKMDTDVQKHAIDAETRKTEVEASVTVLQTFKDDPVINIFRDLLVAPPVCYSALYYWDKMIEHSRPDLVWTVSAIDNPTMGYLIYAVIVFLLGNLYLNRKQV